MRQISTVVFMIGCASLWLTAASCEPVERLHPTLDEAAENQVREYQGELLSSIKDFRENSIRGPQFVDPSRYALAVSGLVESETHFSYEQVLSEFQTHERLATLDCEEGWGVTLLWEGVLLRDVLDAAGVLPEAALLRFGLRSEALLPPPP